MCSTSAIPGLPENFAKNTSVQTAFFSFHGIGLSVSSNEASLLQALVPSLKHFNCTEAELPSPHIRLTFLSCKDLKAAPFAPPAHSKEVSSSGNIKYFSEEAHLFTVFPEKFQVFSQLNEGWATGFVDSSFLSDTWAIKQLLFYPPFAELLKPHKIFNVHGSLAATSSGRAILITAQTGGGKSTTLVNLVRNGYSFLSDDISLVTKDDSGLRLLGFPELVNLTPQAVLRFPELEFLKDTPKPCPSRKHSFSIEEVYNGCLRESARPGWIVFPQVYGKSTPTQLVPLAKKDALSLLIPQSVVVAHKAIVKQHLQILTQLVQECSCFHLQLGQNANQKVPELFAALK